MTAYVEESVLYMVMSGVVSESKIRIQWFGEYSTELASQLLTFASLRSLN